MKTSRLVTKWPTYAPQLLSVLRIVAAFMFILPGTMKLFAFPIGMPPDGGTAQLRLSFGFMPRSSAQTQPRIFAEGVISTGDHESHPAFSPDGRMLMFVKMAPDLSKWTLFVSYDSSNGWSEPEIAPFSGQYWDADPFFTKDGKTLYFISNRPAKPGDPPKDDFDIWKVEKEERGWSAPVQLPPPINSERSEYYPTLADNGSMYFGSRREGGKGATDIYFSRLENGKYRMENNFFSPVRGTNTAQRLPNRNAPGK